MRFLTLFLFLCAALLLQISVGGVFGISLELAWTVLFAAVFFLNFGELALLIALFAGTLFWMPFTNLMCLFMIVLPIIIFVLLQSLQFKPFFGNLFFIILGTFCLYLFFAPRLLVVRPTLIAVDVLLSALFGAFVFWIMEIAVKPY